jgi:hypothetical protein
VHSDDVAGLEAEPGLSDLLQIHIYFTGHQKFKTAEALFSLSLSLSRVCVCLMVRQIREIVRRDEEEGDALTGLRSKTRYGRPKVFFYISYASARVCVCALLLISAVGRYLRESLQKAPGPEYVTSSPLLPDTSNSE